MTKGFATGWRQVACCFLLLASSAFIAAGYSVVAVPLGREFHPTRMVLMLAMTIMAAVSGVLSPFLGSLMDRASMRRIMTIGACFLVAGYIALSFTTSFIQVLIVFGLFVAPANVLCGPVASTVLISRWFAAKRGTAIGIAIAGVAMGSVFYPPILQTLLDHNDWRTAFRLFALVIGVIAVPAALLVVDSPAARGLHPDGADRDPEVGHARAAAAPVSARAILTDPAFWLAVAIFSVTVSGVKGMVTNLAPLAIDQGITAKDAAWMISLYGMSAFVSKLSFAVIADRIAPRTLMIGSLVGFAGGMACVSQAANGYGTILAGVCLVGLAGGVIVPLQSYLVPQIFGHRVVGRAMGLMSMVMLVALLSTPPLFGGVYDATGSYTAIFLVFAGLAIATALLVPYLRLQARSEAPPAPPQQTEALV